MKLSAVPATVLFSLALSTQALASSVCMVQALHYQSGNDQVAVACDTTDPKVAETKQANWSIADIAPLLQTLVTQGYKVVTQADNIWTLVKE